MIYICSDFHGDLNRFKKSKIKFKKNDTVIILGDFGFLNGDDDIMEKSLKWLFARKYTICFIDGGIDNRKKLLEYKEEPLFGAISYHIGGNVYYLPRGNVYTIENKTFLTFGGGENLDYLDQYTEEESFISGRIDQGELDYMEINLKKVYYKVDYILTHDAPKQIREICLMSNNDKANDIVNISNIHNILQQLRDKTTFKQWFCGKYHIDRHIPPIFTVVFLKTITIK